MDLIGQLTQQLGVSPDTARSAAGSVFQLLQKHAPAGAFQQLLGAAPEVQGWMDGARAATGGPGAVASGGGVGGGLGGMLGAAAGMLGGAGGGTAGQLALLSGLLGKLGLPPDVAGRLVPPVLQFIQSRGGQGLVQQLAAGVPLLQAFLGGGSPGPQGAGPGGLRGGRF